MRKSRFASASVQAPSVRQILLLGHLPVRSAAGRAVDDERIATERIRGHVERRTLSADLALHLCARPVDQCLHAGVPA